MIKTLSALCSGYKRKTYTKEDIERFYEKAKNLNSFYNELANELLIWEEKFSACCGDPSNFDTNWFINGKISPIYNILKVHLEKRKNKAAIIWRGTDYAERILTYQSLYSDVSKFASALKKLGLKKGDQILIYLPNIPEIIIAMLACVKIGVIHTVYHPSYSSENLANRLNDCKYKMIITADGYFTKTTVNLKEKVDEAINMARHKPNLCVVVKRLGQRVHMKPLRDLWYHDLISDEDYSKAFAIEEAVYDANDTIFTLITSTHHKEPTSLRYRAAGFLLWAKFSHLLLFDPSDEDVLWNTADIAWITGHVYKVYGPLLNGQTVFIYEDTIDSDNSLNFYEFLDKYNINKLYTTPTTLNRLMKADEKKGVFRYQKHIQFIATGGEKRDEESLRWAFNKLVHQKYPIVNILTITEAGGAISGQIIGYSEINDIYSVGKPLPGISLTIIDGKKGEPINQKLTKGEIVFSSSFPSLTSGACGNRQILQTIYIKNYGKTKYFRTGDGGEYTEHGDINLLGRLDDVLHISGKRINMHMIEEAIKKHEKIKDAAVVNVIDEKRGETLIAFCVLKKNIDESLLDDIFREINELIIDSVGEMVTPDIYKITTVIPKTPTGEVQRDILKEVAMQMT